MWYEDTAEMAHANKLYPTSKYMQAKQLYHVDNRTSLHQLKRANCDEASQLWVIDPQSTCCQLFCCCPDSP